MVSGARYFCYILKNDKDNHTYVGCTNDLINRLRRHNCEIVGGARFTTNRCKKMNCKWSYFYIVGSDQDIFDKHMALSLEWHIKHKRKCSRSESIAQNLASDKFNGICYTVYMDVPIPICLQTMSNINVKALDEIIHLC